MLVRQMSRVLRLGMVLLVVLAHVLLATSLIGFGLRSDGWVLHPVGVSWYSLIILGSLGLLVRTLHTPDARPELLILLPLLTLAVMGSFPITALMGGARYAPYDTGEIHELFVGLNLVGGLALVILTLLYRRPRLLLTWALGQGVLLVTYPTWWGGLWRWGSLGNSPLVLALVFSLPLLYALTLRVLNVRLRRRWLQYVVGGLVVSALLILLAALRLTTYLNSTPFIGEARIEMWRAVGWNIPLLLAFGGLLVPLPLWAGRELGEREEQGELERPFPAELLILLLLVTVPLQLRFFQTSPDGMLPAAGQVQLWRSADHIVPHGWLPTLAWSRWLLQLARWLSIPYALFHLMGALRSRDGQRQGTPTSALKPGLLTFPTVLLGVGLLWLVALTWNLSRWGLPLTMVEHRPAPLSGALAILGSLLLLLAARALASAERVVGWRGLWQALTALGLGGVMLWAGAKAWTYGRLLLAPLPAWTAAERWASAPLPRIPLAALGLALHLLLLGGGLFALRCWIHTFPSLQSSRRIGLQGALSLLALILIVGVGWWVSTPRIVETVPPAGATAVSREIAVSIQMRERTWMWDFLGHSSFGISAHYADTGAYISGTSGGSTSSLHFRPEAPLRAGAPVKVVVQRSGERPYILQFTTVSTVEP